MTIDRNQQSLADLIEQTSSYQLPSISKTNAITSSFDNDLLKATEGQIEESIRAEKEEATLYSAQLNDVYEAKKKRAQALRGLIPTGIAVAQWVNDERKAHNIYKQHEEAKEKAGILFQPRIMGGKPLSQEEWELYNNYEFQWDLQDSDNPVIPFYNADEEFYKNAFKESKLTRQPLEAEISAFERGEDGELTPGELYFLMGQTATGVEVDNKAIFFDGQKELLPSRYQTEITFVFPAGSVVNDAGEGLPRPMSYLDALSSTNQEDNMWIPYLKEAMWSVHYARVNNIPGQEGVLETFSQREIKNKLFKPWLENVNKQQGVLIEAQLADRIKLAKGDKYNNFLSDLRSNGWDAAVGPKYGFVALNEIRADGTIDNPRGFQELINAFDWLEKNDKISGQEINHYINQPFKARGSKKPTTLQKLKPEVYYELSQIAKRAIKKDLDTKELLQSQDIDDSYITVAESVSKAVEEGAGDETIQAMIIKEQKRLADKYGIPVDSEKLGKFKTLASKSGLADAYQAIDELNRLYAAGERLPTNLINKIPSQTDLFGDGRYDRGYWESVQADVGNWGLTSSQIKDGEARLDAIIKNLPRNKFTSDKGVTERMINQKEQALVAYQANYASLMNASASELTGASKEQINAIQERNRVAAMEATKKQLEEGLFDARTTIKFPSEVEGGEPTSLEQANQRAELFTELKGDKQAILTYQYYWPGEEAALNEYLKYKSSGGTEGTRFPSYYYWATPNGRVFPDSPKDEVMEARLKATAHLRDTGNTDQPVVDSTNNNLTHEEKIDLCTFPSAAKTGQKICSSPEHAAWMLEAVLDPKAEAGADSAYEYKTKYKSIDHTNQFETPLSQTSLQDVFIYGIDNPNARFGKYGLTLEQLTNQIDKQGLDKEEGLLFDDDTQNRIMLGLILEAANKDSSCSTFDNRQRQITHFTQKEKDEFRVVCSASPVAQLNKTFFNSPYNQLDVLMSEVALELTELVLQE